MKNIEFIRFDWIKNSENTKLIPTVCSQINCFLKKHPNYKVIDYKFTAFNLKDEYGYSPAEVALVEFEVMK